MTNRSLLKQVHQKLEQLPPDKIMEVMDFTEFLIAKIEAELQNEALLKMAATSKSFAFVNDDEVEYTLADIKKR